ncbi:MAG: HigA family addiction module antidote protein [Pedobacter sp.]|nr:HigA family addiction module antidote protein [Chitinophagaceae bacterium]
MSNYQVIGRNGKPIETDVTLHPGEIIADELEARDILKKDFAILLDMQPAHLSDLMKGKRHVSARLALKLEQHLGINAAYWLRVQSSYNLFMARKELKDLQAA